MSRVNGSVIIYFYFNIMSATGIWEYLYELRNKGVYKPKQRRVLLQIAVYTYELKVYKVAVFADSKKMSRWKKYNVNELCKVYTQHDNDKNISFPLLKQEVAGSESGYKMFIYSFKNDDVKCFGGEDYEQHLLFQ